MMTGVSQSVLASETEMVKEGSSVLILDNNGFEVDPAYGDCGLVGSYEGLSYYDCYIPYKETLKSIGGEALNTEDGSRYMTEDILNKTVGSVVGEYTEEGKLNNESEILDNGLKIYKDSFGNEYYGLVVPKFVYNESGRAWEYGSGDVSGQLIDAILTDGTVIHFVAETTAFSSTLNGGLGTSTAEDSCSHSEPFKPRYYFLFNDTDGYTLQVSGKKGCGSTFADMYSLSDGSVGLSYIRMYDGTIDDVTSIRKEKKVSSDYEVDYTVYNDMPKVSEEELGKDNNKLVASEFSEEVQKIVEENCTLFDDSNLAEFLASKGGYNNYLKSLGSVFAKYAGDDVKIPVATYGDFKMACEYVYGIICIWGFDYSNGDPGHYGRWRSGDGVNESAVPKDAFYPKGYNIPYEYKDSCASPKRIDLIAAQEGVKRKGVNTCCNYCVDLIRNKLSFAKYLTNDKGKQPGTCSALGQMALTKKLIGKACITDINELQPGDLVHCYNHALTESDKSGENRISGWFHVLYVGERDDEAGTLTMYNTGHDLTNDGDYKQTYKLGKDKNPAGGAAGWLGTRWVILDDSMELSDGSSYTASDSLVPEEDLVGMPDMGMLSNGATSVSLPDSNSLSGEERITVTNVRDSMELERVNSIVNTIRTFIMFIGLCLMLYIVLLYTCYAFDRSNIFFDISLLSIITLGYVSLKDLLVDGNFSLKRLNKASLCLFITSCILISGSLYNFMYKVSTLLR